MTNPERQDTEFKRFAAKRIIIFILLIVAVLWTLGGIMGIIERPEPIPQSALGGKTQEAATHAGVAKDEAASKTAAPSKTAAAEKRVGDDHGKAVSHGDGQAEDDAHASESKTAAHAGDDGHKSDSHADDGHTKTAAAHGDEEEHAVASKALHATATHDDKAQAETAAKKAAKAKADPAHGAASHGDTKAGGHASAVSEAIAPKLPVQKQKGVATVEAVIAPIEYEIEERFWGWRPNDLINVTDNVNNYQRGVLEVTRRAVVALNERISRTGVTDAFDPDLENATNWFMIKATKYWFPSAESKYSEGIADLKKYRDSLEAKRATFYTRPDNLIPLLASFEDLLGSCDENLVKHVEEDGSEVSWFKADNYFYYAQGVAAAMAPILEAIHHDFLITLETRHGIELLHHAVESCHTAAGLKPWIITDSQLDGILANHRANLAAPISHARFFLGVLIKALST